MEQDTQDRLKEFDRMQRVLFVEAVEKGEDMMKATERIKEETRRLWLSLFSYPQSSYDTRAN